MSKLDANLQHAMAAWRADLEHARAGEPPALLQADVINRVIQVVVSYHGTAEPLRQAGLQTGYDDGERVSGRIRFEDVDRLAAVDSVTKVAAEPKYRILLDHSIKEMRVPWKVPPSSPWPGKGTGVIVAVIDTGIDIFHDSFRKSNGATRILEYWDQGATTGGLAPPTGFTQIGRLFLSSHIDAALTAGPPFASIDTIGHGTHVAGIAAGNGRQDDRCSFPGRYVGVAPEADLVVVKCIGLPNGSVRDALPWCAQAGARNGGKPVVINGSFGRDTGPHDGTSDEDEDIDKLLRPTGGPPPGLAIVVSAGNAGELELHESGVVGANGSATVSFVMPDGSSTADTLEVWYTGTASLTVEVIAPPSSSLPGPVTTGPVPPGVPPPFTIGKMSISVWSSTVPIPKNNKKLISIGISTPTGLAARPGIWQLKLTETAGVAAVWDAWFQSSHDDAFPTFHLPGDPTPPIPRRRDNTIGQPGTSLNAITVAAYNDDNGELATFSSWGNPVQPSAPVGQFKPTITAPGVGVAAPRSRNDKDSNSSCCDQKVIDKDGTSMASPHVCGLVALMLEKNKTLTFEQIRARLQHSARVDGIPAADVPPVVDVPTGTRANAKWGSGKVNAALALTETPAAPTPLVGGGGGGGGMPMLATDLGFTPHTLVSRLGEWQNRFGPRPGLMLFASLVSEHVDEVLRLVNHNPRVGAVWKRRGGPLLVRRLLYGPPPREHLLPPVIDGCDVAHLLGGFVPMLDRFGGTRLRADIARFREFAALWPGGPLTTLDVAARRLGGTP